MDAHAKALHDWLAAQRSAGRKVLGYGAASRAVALLCQAHVDRGLLPAVVDASPAKQGLRMPGTDIPVAGPPRLAADRPDAVLLFVPDLLPEVRAAYPEVEAVGRRLDRCSGIARGRLQQDPQPGQAPSPGRPDAPDRQLQLIGDIRVGSGRVGHEHLEQPLPAPGQMGHSVTDDLGALGGQKALIHRGPGRYGSLRLNVLMAQHHPLA